MSHVGEHLRQFQCPSVKTLSRKVAEVSRGKHDWECENFTHMMRGAPHARAAQADASSQRSSIMNRPLTFLFGSIALLLASSADPAAPQMQMPMAANTSPAALDTAKIESLTGLKGSMNAKEG